MGRQIRFFTLTDDEEFLLDFIISIPGNKLIAERTSTPGIRVIDRDILRNSEDIGLRDILIWPSSLEIKSEDMGSVRIKIYDEQLMDFRETDEIIFPVDKLTAPVIEFSRSFFRDDGILVQGRLWCDLKRLVGDKFEYKGRKLENVYDLIYKWIRKNFHRERDVDGYFGKYALDWFRKGGKIFP